MLICIAIQTIYLIYKKATFQVQIKEQIWLVMPLFVCILLLICVIYNVIALVYEMCNKAKQPNNHIICVL